MISRSLGTAGRWSLDNIALPILGIGAAFLHVYTAVTAFNLASESVWAWAAVLAAWVAPPIAQIAVAYYSWRATGSMVNGYSFWLLAWMGWLVGVFFLTTVARRFNVPAG
ncbi:MAG TPA: hypothetical protein VMN56_18425 [Casimicrobiaceae bacterium]|nr:hypothetical protein [Casimicrobiaceae bacterium]